MHVEKMYYEKKRLSLVFVLLLCSLFVVEIERESQFSPEKQSRGGERKSLKTLNRDVLFR